MYRFIYQITWLLCWDDNKKGRVNCAIKSCHCTCAVTKISPYMSFLLLWINDAKVDCDRSLFSHRKLVCLMYVQLFMWNVYERELFMLSVAELAAPHCSEFNNIVKLASGIKRYPPNKAMFKDDQEMKWRILWKLYNYFSCPEKW